MTDIMTGDTYDNSSSERFGNWMQTVSGRKFYPVDPRPDEVFIEDIAHALSMACRYAGHCTRFYSVAEHSVWVSTIVPPDLALIGLLHDATEAYVVDIPRPLKPYLTGYKDIEYKVWTAIADRFGLPHALPDEIKIADNAMLLAEREQNMTPTDFDWCVPGEPAPVRLNCLDPVYAEKVFLTRFHELTA